MKIHVPPVCVLPPFTALFVSGRRRVEGGPAKELNQKDPDQSAQAVKSYVPDPGRTAGHKGLMIFVQPGKAHADDIHKMEKKQQRQAGSILSCVRPCGHSNESALPRMQALHSFFRY